MDEKKDSLLRFGAIVKWSKDDDLSIYVCGFKNQKNEGTIVNIPLSLQLLSQLKLSELRMV